MKTAKLHIAVIEFTCPACGEHIGNDYDGSHLFSIHEPMPETVQCDCCGEKLKVPARAKKLLEK